MICYKITMKMVANKYNGCCHPNFSYLQDLTDFKTRNTTSQHLPFLILSNA
jgi:hypothetical protein